MARIECRVLRDGAERFTIRVYLGRTVEGKRRFETRTFATRAEAEECAAYLEALRDGHEPITSRGVGLKEKGFRLAPHARPERVSRVYLLAQDDDVVYVGQTRGVWPARIVAHRQEGRIQFNQVWYQEYPQGLLNAAEEEWIVHFAPKYNRNKKPRGPKNTDQRR